jgi:molybdenum cofactor cytidylyltransferase
MRLVDGLRLGPGRVAAFTGAGGKSTAIGRLAAEMAAVHPVVVTTTTRLALSQTSLAQAHLIAGQPGALEALPGLLRTAGSVLVTGARATDEPKWLGLEAELLEQVRQITVAAGGSVLVEADGARARSLKAPADYEPVVPACADLVVPLAGLDVLGAACDDGLVHRPERVAEISGGHRGEPLTDAHLQRILTDERGALKGVPPAAEVRLLLNKADNEPRLMAGVRLAEAALSQPRIQAVLLGAVAGDSPVSQVVGRVAGVVLAAGGSARLGRPKQLLPWRGQPLVWHAARAALDGGLDPVAVVAGAEAEAVGASLADAGVRLVENRDWEQGQSTSVRLGLRAVQPGVEAVVFLLADTPFVDAALLRALVACHRRTLSPIVAPRAGDRLANPVLFDRSTFASLLTLDGDRGGRQLFGRFGVQAIDWDPRIATDIDTDEDWRRLLGAG